MVYDDRRQPLGFIEGSIRSDYVNGTESSPVGFVEGVYVSPASRRKGVARQLYDAIGDWARARGCRELASDALVDNELSQRAHRALDSASWSGWCTSPRFFNGPRDCVT
jgi:aminoglycoside 6'-N-acetyltransferase I